MYDLTSGDIFDRHYRVEHKLGQGGFAEVWLATELASSRYVALKVLTPDQGKSYAASTRARFEREVQILARLRDPHTVQLLTYGDCDGRLYLVFEYIPGRDLTEVLAEHGRLEPREVVHMMRQVLASLREAHNAGLVHRDLKPANLRVAEDESDPLAVRVLDFGIARATDDSHPSITRTGELIGTPRYMSPEQLMNATLTPASDLYSLGMIAFELLAGSEALQGERLGDQLDRLRSGHLFSAPQLDHVGALYAVIQKMTARRVEDRYPRAAAVLAALDHAAPSRQVAGDDSHPAVPGHARNASPFRAGLAWVGLAVVALVFVVTAAVRPTSSSDSDEVSPNIPSAILTSETRSSPELGAAEPDLIDLDRADLGASDLEQEAHASGADEFASAGCGRQPDFSGEGYIGDVLTYLPKGYDPQFAHPTIILFHPDFVRPEELFAASGFARYADRDRAVVVVPQDEGVLGSQVWGDREASAVRIRRIYRDLSAMLCLDRSRTYMVGHSDGASVAQPMSCEPWITATAINGYSPNDDGKLCPIARPIVWLHPTRSPNVPNDGSPNCNGKRKLTSGQVREILRERNGCRGRPTDESSHHGSTCQRWACDVPLEFCEIDGGSAWPGTEESFLFDLKCGKNPAPDFPIGDHIWRSLRSMSPLTELVEPS